MNLMVKSFVMPFWRWTTVGLARLLSLALFEFILR